VDPLQSAESPLLEQLFELSMHWIHALVEHHREVLARGGATGEQLLPFGQVSRYRLLQEHVQPRSECVGRDDRVGVVGRRDQHGFDQAASVKLASARKVRELRRRAKRAGSGVASRRELQFRERFNPRCVLATERPEADEGDSDGWIGSGGHSCV